MIQSESLSKIHVYLICLNNEHLTMRKIKEKESINRLIVESSFHIYFLTRSSTQYQSHDSTQYQSWVESEFEFLTQLIKQSKIQSLMRRNTDYY